MENFTEERFNHLPADMLVVLVFGAAWCGPCHKLHQLMEQVTDFYAYKRVRFLDVDIEAHKEFTKRFSITSIPQMLFIKNGNLLGKLVGLQNIKTILEMVNSHL